MKPLGLIENRTPLTEQAGCGRRFRPRVSRALAVAQIHHQSQAVG